MHEKRQDLSSADLRNKDLTGLNLQYACLCGADLQQTNLKGVDLRYADLNDANFEGANLEGADLRGANLHDANFRDAHLQGANLSGAQVFPTDFGGANLSGTQFEGTNLSGCNLRGLNLQGANLHCADLWGTDLSLANLQETNLQSANLQEAILIGAHFEGAIFMRAKLARANLTDATGLSDKQRSVFLQKGARFTLVDEDHYLQVGKAYTPGKLTYGEGMLFGYCQQTGGLLRLTLKHPTAQERNEIQQGAVKLGLLEKNGILFVFAKFGTLAWLDADYHVDFSQPYTLPILSGDDKEQGYPLHVVLVNAADGIVEVLRHITMPSKMAMQFKQVIDGQRGKLPADYEARLASILANYPTADLLKFAEIYSRVREG